MSEHLQQNEKPYRLLTEIRVLLDTFGANLGSKDVREKVLSLIPVHETLAKFGPAFFGTEVPSARDRILTYFRGYPHTIIEGSELALVSGIFDWARRVRELRKQFGWNLVSGLTLREAAEAEPELSSDLQNRSIDIRKLKVTNYVLLSLEQDRDAAHRWNLTNSIRRKKASAQDKILEFLKENIGKAVTGEELRYVARDQSEWARRLRELRTEQGWMISTRHTGRPDLPSGHYVLESARQAPIHDRRISDPVRVKVLSRDGFACTECGWSPEKRIPGDRRYVLELHHVLHHKDKGENSVENLTTLCNVCHDQIHRNSR